MMTVIFITCVMARGKDGAFASNWVATRIIFVPSRSFSSAWGFFYLIENFSEIPYLIKNSPRDRTAAGM